MRALVVISILTLLLISTLVYAIPAVATGGHCGRTWFPGRPMYDYLPPGSGRSGAFVGGICAWHDRCNELKDKTRNNYNCNFYFARALQRACARRWGDALYFRGECNFWVTMYTMFVGGQENDPGPPPPGFEYPPGL